MQKTIMLGLALISGACIGMQPNSEYPKGNVTHKQKMQEKHSWQQHFAQLATMVEDCQKESLDTHQEKECRNLYKIVSLQLPAKPVQRRLDFD